MIVHIDHTLGVRAFPEFGNLEKSPSALVSLLKILKGFSEHECACYEWRSVEPMCLQCGTKSHSTAFRTWLSMRAWKQSAALN
eukprot:3447013-Amphidinium_carterae.1